MPEFVRVSVIGADPTTHITIARTALRPSKHRVLKSPPLDRNGNPRPAKFGTSSAQPEADPADDATNTPTGQEATS